MIASVHGTVLQTRLDSVVVEVGGVGLLVRATPNTVGGLRIGSAARLSTTLVVREDSLTLFGFGDDDERDIFEKVQSVTGIGPRMALAMLAVHTPDGLRAAVAGEDLPALERVPGIGRKSAQRIVLELKDKLGQPSGGTAQPSVASDHRDEVVEALTGLGWQARAAGEAVDAVVAEGGISAEDVPGVLRAALRTLGGRHG